MIRFMVDKALGAGNTKQGNDWTSANRKTKHERKALTRLRPILSSFVKAVTAGYGGDFESVLAGCDLLSSIRDY